MRTINKSLLIYVVLSLFFLITFFIFFVLPQNITPARSYKGTGSPYVHPPAG